MSGGRKTSGKRRLPDLIRGAISVVGDNIDTEQLQQVRSTGSSLIVAGKNVGWGASPEEACAALQEAGVQAMIAESFAQPFRQFSLESGQLILCEASERLCETIQTGMDGELVLTNPGRPTLYVAALKTSWTLGSLEEMLLP